MIRNDLPEALQADQARAEARRKDWSEQDELTNQRRRNWNREYLGCADFCPVCRADDIVADDESFDGTSGTYSVHCNVCDSAWLDIYELKAVQITRAMTWSSEKQEHVDLLNG